MSSLNNEPKKFSFVVFRQMLANSRRLTKIIWQEKKAVMVFLTVVFLFGSAAPFFISGSRGLLINDLVDFLRSGIASKVFIALLAVFILSRVFQSVIFVLQDFLSWKFWVFLTEKFELLLMEKKGALDVATQEDPQHNDLLNKVREAGVFRVQDFIERQFFIIQNLIEVAIASVILGIANVWILVLILIGTAPQLVVEVLYGRGVWGIYSSKAATRRRYWDLKYHFDDLPYLVELKLFQNVRHFADLVKELLHDFHDEEHKNRKMKLKRQLLVLLLSEGAIAFATVWFVLEVVQGNLLIGTLTFILTSMSDFRQSLSSLFKNVGSQYQDSLFVSDVFQFLDLSSQVKSPERGRKLSLKQTPVIAFEKVNFSYPNASKMILSDFSLRIMPGEKIAIVGANGAGKTTLVKLLCRFYDPTSGRVLINGKDLRELELSSWYSMLGVLFQDYAQYHFMAKEVIALGMTDRTPLLEHIKNAAKASEADAFIEEWEQTYEQMLGKRFQGGVEPSTGQWQKLALSRIFYRDPRVLVLDEPTSSIDAEAEAKIFDTLEALPKDRTVIFISHRFSTVRHASTICVIKDGTLAEYGSHEKLMKEDGIYARLFRLQAKSYR